MSQMIENMSLSSIWRRID